MCKGEYDLRDKLERRFGAFGNVLYSACAQYLNCQCLLDTVAAT